MSIHPLSRGLADSHFNAFAAVDHRQLKPGRPATPVVNVQPQRRSIGNLPRFLFYDWFDDYSTARGET
jgi:hypothetical protein